ncbi:MAG: NAD(P)-binding protein [Solirubrobacterales bacterium]
MGRAGRAPRRRPLRRWCARGASRISRGAIVGAGLSGLAAAWYLQGRGAETHVIERDGELGGRAGSGQLGERIMTLGGKNIGRGYTRIRAFTQSLGEYPYEHFGINSSRVIDGQVRTFDSGSRGRALRQLRGPPRDLMRLGRLVLAVRRDPSARDPARSACPARRSKLRASSRRSPRGVSL